MDDSTKELIREILDDHATNANLEASREFHELHAEIERGCCIDLSLRLKRVSDAITQHNLACIARDAFK